MVRVKVRAWDGVYTRVKDRIKSETFVFIFQFKKLEDFVNIRVLLERFLLFYFYFMIWIICRRIERSWVRIWVISKYLWFKATFPFTIKDTCEHIFVYLKMIATIIFCWNTRVLLNLNRNTRPVSTYHN